MPPIKCYTLDELRARASNIVGENKSEYTIEMFVEDFPQFSKIIKEETEEVEKIVPLVPESMLNQFILMANNAIQEKRWFDKWRYGMGLYVAHYSALYLRTYQEATKDNTPSQAASGASVLGAVATASLGDQSISYDNSAITAGTQRWGSWNATTYGQQLITEAKLLGKGGAFII